MSWRRWSETELDAIDAAGLRRTITDFDARGPAGRLGGRDVVSFASNDYLGLTNHPAVVAAGHEALERWGAGSGAARLLVGARPIHSELEKEIAGWKGTERALLFPTGFAANLGVLAALGAPDVLICSDRLNHASIVDGARLSRAQVAVFPHRDAPALERILAAHSGRTIVVSDVVFSMDGDEAPLEDLVAASKKHNALLVLDEAHDVFERDIDLSGVEVLRVGTLSKFLGAAGGFVAGPGPLVDLLVNRARSFIFTTATPPADAAAALAALRIVRSDEGERLRTRLRALIDRVAPGQTTPIVSMVVGDERAATAASAALLARGVLVPAIRPPSVPPGTSRLRIALSAAHTDDQVDLLLGALDEVVGVTT
ncbi:MAG TPA: 8-amino-7-oxononanoate synthase [Actinomycetota bacterium]|nr:8-amino-7-oxononanoate synthase [Actinomycetota bacterium]